jgi:hypothetical protein
MDMMRQNNVWRRHQNVITGANNVRLHCYPTLDHGRLVLKIAPSAFWWYAIGQKFSFRCRFHPPQNFNLNLSAYNSHSASVTVFIWAPWCGLLQKSCNQHVNKSTKSCRLQIMLLVCGARLPCLIFNTVGLWTRWEEPAQEGKIGVTNLTQTCTFTILIFYLRKILSENV